MNLIKALILLSVIAGSLAHGSVTDRLLSGAELNPRAEFAHVSLPAVMSDAQEIEVTLVLGLPYGCYRPDVGVEHRDAYTHVLKPILLDDGHRCSRPTSLEFQKTSLGYLATGEHTIVVENVVQRPQTLRFWVHEGKVAEGDHS